MFALLHKTILRINTIWKLYYKTLLYKNLANKMDTTYRT